MAYVQEILQHRLDKCIVENKSLLEQVSKLDAIVRAVCDTLHVPYYGVHTDIKEIKQSIKSQM